MGREREMGMVEMGGRVGKGKWGWWRWGGGWGKGNGDGGFGGGEGGGKMGFLQRQGKKKYLYKNFSPTFFS